MKTIVHISDLHFGRLNEAVMQPLEDFIKEMKPDVLVISGDLTMRAKKREFMEAKIFLNKLPFPQIIVPGNHDIPLYNVWTRFFQAFKKYRKYISEDLEPIYQDENVLMYGLNTARSYALVRGRVDLNQVEKICAEFDKLPKEVLRVVVTHHPFDLPGPYRAYNLQQRPAKAMEMLIKSRVDLFLAGHTHKSIIDHVPERAKELGFGPLIIQAGTTTSRRTRHDHNTFNVIKWDYPVMQIDNYFWEREARVFAPRRIKKFTHTEQGWQHHD